MAPDIWVEPVRERNQSSEGRVDRNDRCGVPQQGDTKGDAQVKGINTKVFTQRLADAKQIVPAGRVRIRYLHQSYSMLALNLTIR